MAERQTAAVRRTNYEPSSDAEEFIVPLLRDKIHDVVGRYISQNGGGRRLLDVGCGRQPFRKMFETMGYAYVGFDIEQTPETSVDVLGAIDGDLPRQLSEGDKFDVIFCTEVLEHVVDWTRAFKNIASLLQGQGVAIITTPHVYMLHEEPHDYWRATPYTFSHFADDSGLKIIHYESAGDAWDVLGN